MLYVLVQIIIAIVLIILMGILAYGIYNKNAQEILLDIIKPNTIKKETKIINGVFSYDANNSASFNTTNKSNGNYVDLNPSINQKGGSVYTYNFWLYIPDSIPNISDLNEKTLVLFNKGSKQLINYKSSLRCDTTDLNSPWFLVKNPLVRLDFSDNSKVSAIIVEFNSIENPDVFHSGANIGNKNCSEKNMIVKDSNLIGIKGLEKRTDLTNSWNMVTIVVSETSPENDVFVTSNQAIVKLYLNGYAYLNKDGQVEDKSTAMKINNSDIHLGIDSSTKQLNSILNIPAESKIGIGISDLTYFNYILDDKEIINLFNKGCNKNTALIPSAQTFFDAENKNANLEIKGMSQPVAIV
jgi:hypothetical protein